MQQTSLLDTAAATAGNLLIILMIPDNGRAEVPNGGVNHVASSPLLARLKSENEYSLITLGGSSDVDFISQI